MTAQAPVMVIRRPAPGDQADIQAFVQAIVDETYAFVWPSGAPPIDVVDWTSGWIVDSQGRLSAAMLTSTCWLDDLWVEAGNRNRGIGSALLAHAEAEIAARGHDTAKLRVVAGNDRALQFYLKRGWTIEIQQAHERLPISMITLQKMVARAGTDPGPGDDHSAAKQ